MGFENDVNTEIVQFTQMLFKLYFFHNITALENIYLACADVLNMLIASEKYCTTHSYFFVF